MTKARHDERTRLFVRDLLRKQFEKNRKMNDEEIEYMLDLADLLADMPENITRGKRR